MKTVLRRIHLALRVLTVLAILTPAAAEQISATITGIKREFTRVEVLFTVSGNPARAYIEASPDVKSGYRVEPTALITNTAPSVFRARIPVVKTNRFLRVRLVAEVATNSVVVPLEAEQSFGDGSVNPEGVFQQVYPAKEFSVIGDLIEITGMAFRINEGGDSLDRLVSGDLELGVFRGSMLDVPRRESVPMYNSVFVSKERNIHVSTSSNDTPATFHLQFTFNTPYIYDLRMGQLVLLASIGAVGKNVDGVNVDSSGGWIFRESNLPPPTAGPGLIVTKFTYVPIQTSQ
jgi:hypothetical protein